MSSTKLAVAPVIEPFDLDDAKSHLKVDHADEDPLIDLYVRLARRYCEDVSRRAFCAQTWEMTLDAWPTKPVVDLPYPPLQSVEAISYVDRDDITHTMPAADYGVDTDSEPGRVYLKIGKSWPSGMLRPVAGVKIRFVAGYADVASIPEVYQLAMRWMLSLLHENRGDNGLVVPGNLDAMLMMDRGSW